jgi:hypothetical protein
MRAQVIGLTGLVSILSAVAIAACSSSGGDGGTTPPADTGTASGDTATTTDTGTGTDTNTAIDSGTTTDTGTVVDDTSTGTDSGGDSGSTCGSDPTLHPLTADGGVVPGVYCPGAGADGGSSTTCATGQICCDTVKGSTPPSSCIAGGTTCPATTPKAGSSWECDGPQHCTGGKICCGLGAPALRKGCTYEEVYPALGTVCETSCSTSQYIVCEAAGDCPSGKTCTPIKSGSKQIGYCK